MATKKYFLSFHTIFILSENIQWLEEFLIYYKHIGFDHFYLYDNMGSSGGADNTDKHSRWGYDAPTSNSESDKEKLTIILDKYGDMITYVNWQPRNEKGDIHYGQVEGIHHVIQTYGHETEWLALMDFDEFLFSPSNMNIVNYFRTLPQNISNVRLSMKTFVDRHEAKSKYITQDFRCIEGVSMTYSTGCKNIIRTNDFISTTNIHHGYNFKQTSIDVDRKILRFNHYNGNPKQIQCLKDFFKVDVKLSALDTGMSRYSKLYGLDSTNILTPPVRPKIVCLGDFNSSSGLGLKTMAQHLSESYEFVYHNVYHFWMETFTEDIKQAYICIFTKNALDVYAWDTFPKSRSIISKIILLLESQEELNHINVKPTLACAVMKASTTNTTNTIDSTIYYLPPIIDTTPFLYTPRDSYEFNTIGWCGELTDSIQSKNWVLSVAGLVQVPISICSSQVPFQRRKEWYRTIDVLISIDTNTQYIYEAVASGIPVITNRYNGLPGPIVSNQADAAAVCNEYRANPEKAKTLAQQQYTYLLANHSLNSVKSVWTQVFNDIAKKSYEQTSTIVIGKYLYNNLAHRLDRKTHMENQFSAIHISSKDILRIDACYRPEFGHLGCSESHIKALQTAMTNDWEWTAIFEDDFTFRRPESFQAEIQQALKTFQPDILLLAQGDKGLSFEETLDPTIIRIKRSVTASGYIIHKDYVPILLKNFQDSRNQLEVAGKDATWFCLDQAWAPLQRTDRWFGFKQPIGYQEEGHSDIVGGYVRYNC